MSTVHTSSPPAQPVTVDDQDLVRRALALTPEPAAAERVAVGRDLLRCSAFALGEPFGPAATAWWSEGRLWVSALPDDSAGQRTLVFELDGDRLVLGTVWRSDAQGWAAVGYREFDPFAADRITDRTGCDAYREALLGVLAARGARYGLPVTPDGQAPPALCGWVARPVDGVGEDFDRDPRLVDPQYNLWAELLHHPTGALTVSFVMQGGWSRAALTALREALDALVPGRTDLLLMPPGRLRVVVLLGHADRRSTEPPPRVVFHRVAAAYVRACAAQRSWAVPPRPASAAMAPPGPERVETFRACLAAFGDEEIPDLPNALGRNGSEFDHLGEVTGSDTLIRARPASSRHATPGALRALLADLESFPP